MTRIAIIGAGLAGLTLAQKLAGRAEVALFEKSAGPGGRMATRYADPYRFDHGAQFFVARSAAFRAFIEPLVAGGVLAPWHARFVEFDDTRMVVGRTWDDSHPHYVATPGMNQLGKYLATVLDLRLRTTVSTMSQQNGAWRLVDAQGASLGEYDWVVSTAPAAQTAQLLPSLFAHHDALQSTNMSGCCSLMLGFGQPLPLAWDAALVRNADISWISVNSSKPGREAAFTLVVHSTNGWAEAHLDDDPQQIEQYMLAQAQRIAGFDLTQADHRQLHRWRYANADKQTGPKALIDTDNRLAACGDWCIHGRVESAFASACSLDDMLPV